MSAGTALMLNIEWPNRLEGRVPLQLVAEGTVVRRDLSGFAVKLERYHFRIAGRRGLQAEESFQAGA